MELTNEEFELARTLIQKKLDQVRGVNGYKLKEANALVDLQDKLLLMTET